jgi:DNA-binding NarL/FixJ family response regulator
MPLNGQVHLNHRLVESCLWRDLLHVMISATRNVTAIAEVRQQFDDVAIFGVPSSALTTVLICGDPIWDHALGWLVSSAGLEVVGRGYDVHRTPELVERFDPKVVLIETSAVESADLYKRLKQVHKWRPAIRTIVLCALEEAADRDAALAGGATCIVSRENAVDLLKAIDFVCALGDDSPNDRPRLTRRELEILRLVARGRTNRQVAQLIWVTDQTVKYHLANVYRKLGVGSRAEAVEWAFHNGLTDRTPVPAGR